MLYQLIKFLNIRDKSVFELTFLSQSPILTNKSFIQIIHTINIAYTYWLLSNWVSCGLVANLTSGTKVQNIWYDLIDQITDLLALPFTLPISSFHWPWAHTDGLSKVKWRPPLS